MDKVIKSKNCTQCSKSFDITQNDRDFYTKVSPSFVWKKFQIPNPTLCPECRQQRRLCWKNELQLYKNTCCWCGTNMITRFHEKSYIKNYCNKCWSSDNWEAKDYGKEIDFTRPVFEQISELIRETPFQNLIGSLSNIENNAVYTNCTADIKDSYMVSESDFIENCYYGRLLRKSHNLFDCLDCSNSEYCYECQHSDGLYNCFFLTHSSSSRDMIFAHDCHGCSNCIWCVGLSNKQYFVLNQSVSQEEYEDTKIKLRQGKYMKNMKDNFLKLLKSNKQENSYIVSSEYSSGKIIRNSRNCENCSLVVACEDCRYCEEINTSKDLYDISSYGSNSYLMYESMWVGRYSHNVLFCSTVWRGENLLYCIETKKSQDCFWCVNLKDGKYCILNKQYSRQEYEELVPKIIEHMKKTWEWGEFFPASISPFWYNETLAQEYFPISKRQAEEKWYNWSDYKPPLPKVDKIISASKLPEDIHEIPDDILNWAIECEVTKKPFRIIQQELAFYRKYNLPVPRKHPDQRRVERIRT